MRLLMTQLKPYIQLTRMDRPIGTMLLLWPTLWALWMAMNGQPPFYLLLIFVIGTFLMRSAGCIINDIADRNIDGLVERTKNRPLASGQISLKAAAVLFIILLFAAFLILLPILSPLILSLALLAVLITIIYPFSKRWLQAPQMVLGVAFAWGVPMAFAVGQHQLPLHCWALFIATLLWIVSYDTMYAMADRDDDRKIGVYSTAILFAAYDRLIIALIQTSLIVILVILGIMLKLSMSYYLALMVAATILTYQQWLIRNRERSRCLQAFINNHWFGLVVFVGILLSYY